MRDLSKVVHNLKKSLGENAIKTGDELKEVEVKPTGIPMFDLQLGGGFRMRGINLLAGKPQSGKTSIAMQFCGQCQKDGFVVLWVDLEKQFDVERAQMFGMNLENLIVLESSRKNELLAENLQRQVSDFIREMNKQPDNRLVIVLDSLAANVSGKDTLEDDVQKIMGGDARINNQSIKIWNSLLDHNQCFILINEFRDKIGEYGNPEYPPGGLAQLYFSSTITYTRQGSSKDVVLDDDKTPIGERFNWTVKKSRNAPPRETGGITFYYETGFDINESLIQACLDVGILNKSGSWFILPNGDRVQGEDKFVLRLKETPELFNELQLKLYAQMPRKLYEYVEEDIKENVQN